MSMLDDEFSRNSMNEPRKQKLKRQRADVAKILSKVQEAIRGNEVSNVDDEIDRGIILERASEGLEYLFTSSPGVWKLLFPMEFYKQIYRLNDWPITEQSLKQRPGIVGTWTNWMIYIRFPVGTIKWLREHRIQDGRSHTIKFHQFSSEVGRQLIVNFINSAIDLMSKCTTWDQFKRRLAEGYGKTYQQDMFDKDDINWKPA